MASVEIAYCHPCGFLDRASRLQRSLLEDLGQDLEWVGLAPRTHVGVRVTVDGETVFDTADEEFDVETILAAVRDVV